LLTHTQTQTDTLTDNKGRLKLAANRSELSAGWDSTQRAG